MDYVYKKLHRAGQQKQFVTTQKNTISAVVGRANMSDAM